MRVCVRAQAEEERRFAASWAEDRARGLEREAAEARVRKERADAMKRDLDSMTSVRSRLKGELRGHAEATDREALEKWEAERAAVEEREKAKREAERAVRLRAACVCVCACVREIEREGVVWYVLRV